MQENYTPVSLILNAILIVCIIFHSDLYIKIIVNNQNSTRIIRFLMTILNDIILWTTVDQKSWQPGKFWRKHS